MHQYISLWSGDFKAKIHSWWIGKTQEEQANLESIAVITASVLGTAIGLLVVLAV